MKALKNIYKNKLIQALKIRRHDLVISPCKFTFQGLAYYTGVQISMPNETMLIEPLSSGAFMIRSTSPVSETVILDTYTLLRKYLDKNF